VLQIAHFNDAILNLKNNIIKKYVEFFGEDMMGKETINMLKMMIQDHVAGLQVR